MYSEQIITLALVTLILILVAISVILYIIWKHKIVKRIRRELKTELENKGGDESSANAIADIIISEGLIVAFVITRMLKRK
jgi:lysylphosphatidylglycerol synthetase-like protein (DUF2156 family)